MDSNNSGQLCLQVSQILKVLNQLICTAFILIHEKTDASPEISRILKVARVIIVDTHKMSSSIAIGLSKLCIQSFERCIDILDIIFPVDIQECTALKNVF